jgi:hypothetical protein
MSKLREPVKVRAMWAITSYYNPMWSKPRLRNYRIFRKNLAVPLVTVELSFDGRFELTQNDADVLIRISGGAIVWQKERLLNIAVKSVPQSEGRIAWLDSDFIFGRADWMDAANVQLESDNVVQLYSELVDLPPNITDSDPSISASGQAIVSFAHESGYTESDVAPLLEKGRAAGGPCMGLAWAARREILEAHGLYDAMIIGSGDRLLVGTLYGQFQKIVEIFEFNEVRRQHYLTWARPYYEAVGGRVGYIPGKTYHLWHGDSAHRKTLGRHGLLARFDFDPGADLIIGANGAWQWKRSKPDLEKFLADYIVERTEDR